MRLTLPELDCRTRLAPEALLRPEPPTPSEREASEMTDTVPVVAVVAVTDEPNVMASLVPVAER